MTKTTLSRLKTGDKFSFDRGGKHRAIYDFTGSGHYVWKWDTGNLFEPVQRGKNDCEVWKFEK